MLFKDKKLEERVGFFRRDAEPPAQESGPSGAGITVDDQRGADDRARFELEPELLSVQADFIEIPAVADRAEVEFRPGEFPAGVPIWA